MSQDAPLILHTNDHEATRYVGTRILRSAGFRVIEAGSGEEALRLLDQHPDLLVLDVKLPDMSGHEVVRMLRSSPATASLLVLQTSATYTTSSKRAEGLEGGADGYLVAPYEPEELIAQVRALLRLNRVETELRRKAEQLALADLRKDEFLAMLAHELRNPLAAITTALPLLGVHRQDADRFEGVVAVINRQTRNLARMVDDLLDVSRITRGKIHIENRPLDLRNVLAEALEVIRPAVQTRSQWLNASVGDRPLPMQGDATRLEQVFVNLLDNASKYTPTGGRIDLEATPERTPDGGHRVSVRVTDNGMGISPEVLPSVFELFVQDTQTLDRSRGGMGIGLTLVRKIIELHGGRVEARSSGRNQGSEFVVQLPLARESHREASRGDDRPRRQLPARRVLLIEDNIDALHSLAEYLGLLGHEVAVAADGEAGISTAASFGPDVVIADIGLPKLDGFGVAQRLRKASNGDGHRVYLVALTGYGGQQQRERALSSGFDLHLVKPVEPEALARLLSEL